ncbi:MAG: flagellar protein FlaG [Bacillota bacterium]|nr:hypothetical protein [Bacillota bacterium]HWR54961.1 flagellar protein FlaG [Negativicutes bacterium]
MNVGAVSSSAAAGLERVKVEQKPVVLAGSNYETTQSDSESKAELDKAVNKLNKTADIYNHEIKFTIHEETHRIMVQVIDKQTDEVISEMPPKVILDMVATFQEMVGLLVDKKA